MLTDKKAKLPWPACLEELRKAENLGYKWAVISWLGLNNLANFCTLIASSLLSPPLSDFCLKSLRLEIVPWWAQPKTLPAETFLYFCFQRWVHQRRPCRIWEQHFLLSCIQLGKQINQLWLQCPWCTTPLVIHWHQVWGILDSGHYLRWSCGQLSINNMGPHMHLFTWPNDLPSFWKLIYCFQDKEFTVKRRNTASQLNRNISTEHRTKIRQGVRNGREQTLHFQNMCLLEFIPLQCWV